MDRTVETACKALVRKRLLTADAAKVLYTRWRREAGTKASDLAAFTHWLAVAGAVTDYQAGVIGRGNVDQLVLGDYAILDRIAKGRMAGVYKARHRLGQTVAVKVLPSSKARVPELLARFHREARLALRLKHPNVVRTFQAGRAGSLHYLVMEHLEGETLEDVLKRRGKLPPAEAVRLVHQALLGLQHLHEQGVVHRDLKPANLMLAGGNPDTTANATVKLLDIGLGRALFDESAAAGAAEGELTSKGDLLGTLEYMAPEQARDARSADVRADIYSLGCVLYHALTGGPPFVGTNRVRILVQHAKETPPPVATLNPEVPEGLGQVLDWMLAKDPARRYPTPERAALALQVFLVAGEPAPATPGQGTMASYLDWLAEHAVQVVGEPDPTDLDVDPVTVEPAPTPAPRPARGPAPKSAARPSVPRKAKIARGPADTELIREPVMSVESVEEDEEGEEVESAGGLSGTTLLLIAGGVGAVLLLVGGGVLAWALLAG
jgi:tRNA A-37 threonylcarbamoyl transferase component Bud32